MTTASRADQELLKIAEQACALARRRGARQVAASVRRSRSAKLVIRDGLQEELKLAETRSLALRVYVDGRYGVHQTSALEPAALERFLAEAIELTRLLAPDPLRGLPERALCEGRSHADLGLVDPAYGSLTMALRKQRATALHDAARAAGGAAIISVGAGVSDSLSDSVLVTSDGFADGERETSFGQWADVSVRDPSGKRPSDWDESSARRVAELEPPARTGERAAARALAQLGAKKIDSCKLPLIVENRAVSRLLSGLLAPLDGRQLDQKQSCFEGYLGKQVATPGFSLVDDPLLRGGWGSARFDWEGLTLRRRPLIEAGVLRDYLVDSYYAKKLKRAPSSSSTTNLVFPRGAQSLEGLCAAAGRAILVSEFIGGNSNSTTGDFSLGLRGFLVEGGKRAAPVAELNIAGNHRELWKTIQALGDDPYPHSAQLTPSVLFAAMPIAGR